MYECARHFLTQINAWTCMNFIQKILSKRSSGNSTIVIHHHEYPEMYTKKSANYDQNLTNFRQSPDQIYKIYKAKDHYAKLQTGTRCNKQNINKRQFIKHSRQRRQRDPGRKSKNDKIGFLAITEALTARHVRSSDSGCCMSCTSKNKVSKFFRATKKS